MNRKNIEIKARIEDLEEIKARAKKFSGRDPEKILMVDTFYKVNEGRLKLRDFVNGHGQLIYYKRDNKPGPKLSEFTTAEFNSKEACEHMDLILSKLHGHLGVVRKTRFLYMMKTCTRIHVDEVESLGNFIEFEIPVTDNATENAEKIAEDLMEKFGVKETSLVSVAYLDLILAKNQKAKENDTLSP